MGEEKVVTGEVSEDEFILKAFSLLNKKVERLAAEREELATQNLYQAEGVKSWSAVQSAHR